MADVKLVRIESLPVTTEVNKEEDFLIVQQPDLTRRTSVKDLMAGDPTLSHVVNFHDGGTLNGPMDFCYYEEEDLYLRWTGEFPHIVPSLSSPYEDGDITDGAWAVYTDPSLRDELGSTIGASLVLTEDGRTIQDTMDEAIDAAFEAVRVLNGLSFERVTVVSDANYLEGYAGHIVMDEKATVHFPDVARGENTLNGFVSKVVETDTSNVYEAIMQGGTTGAIYTIRVSEEEHRAVCHRHALKSELNRYDQNNPSRTVIHSGADIGNVPYLQLDTSGRWGVWSPATQNWQPLAMEQGGTGVRDTATFRRNFAVFHRSYAALESDFNINNLKGPDAGVYYQPMSAHATAANGYPCQQAGVLIVLQNNANGGDGCRQEYHPFNTEDTYYSRWYNAGEKTWQAWVTWARPVNTNSFREWIGLGADNAPTFYNLQLRSASNNVGPSGILNGIKYKADGTTEDHGFRIYSEVRNDNKTWLTLHLKKGPKGNQLHKFLGFSEDGNFVVPYTVDCNTFTVHDLNTTRNTLQVNRFIQAGSETAINNPTDTAKIIITEGKLWGAYDIANKSYIPLGIGQGGTGAKDPASAWTNLGGRSLGKMDSIGLTDGKITGVLPVSKGGTGCVSDTEVKAWLERIGISGGGSSTGTGGSAVNMTPFVIQRPAGAEEDKYYPVIINTPSVNGTIGTDLLVHTKSALGTAPMNCSTLRCWYRTGGWTDRGDSAYGIINFYQNEASILGLVVPTRGQQNYAGIYVHEKAFPIYVYASSAVTDVQVYAEDFVVGTPTENNDGVVYKAGITTLQEAILGDDITNTRHLFDFTGGVSGFYCNQRMYRGNREKWFLQNKTEMGETELWYNGLKYICPGSQTTRKALESNAGFLTRSEGAEDLINGTFTSRCGNLGQAEFRATNRAGGQIIVRDMTGTAHRFWNFNTDGTFSSPNGFVCHQGADWNNQFGNNNPCKVMAGNTNGPEGAMVVGGLSVAFSGNYAFQMAGRLDQLYTRSIEGGNHRAWNKVIQHRGQGLGTNDLNDYKGDREGFYHQEANAQAALDKNYPCSQAGTLVVYRNYANAPESCVQEYTTYLGEKFLRYGTTIGGVFTWGHWQQLGGKGITLKTPGSNLEPEFTIHTGGGTDVTNTSNMPSNTGRLYYWGNGADRKNVLEFQISDNPTAASWVFHCGAKADEAKSRYFAVNGTVECTTVSQSSDRDLKDNIEVIPNALEAIRKMKGYTYTLKENGMPYAGVIAQEVMEALPEAVGSFVKRKEIEGPTQDGIPLMTEERFYNVDYAAVTGLLVQVCREQDDKITALEEQVKKLTEVVTGLQEKLK